MTPDQNLELKVHEALNAGCSGVVYTGVEVHVLEWMAAVVRAKAGPVDWVFLTPAYTANVAERLGVSGNGIFAMSEFEPWSSRSGMLNDWREVMTRGKVLRTSFSQGGYVAAQLFVRVLRLINGDINRESVTRAFKTLAPQKIPMLGTSFEFGPGPAHASNRANLPVQLQDGTWRVAHWEFIVAPSPAR
jgi:branched-chain amino acid transport system substrate-binding protein